MAKGTNSIPIPPRPYQNFWPNPQLTLPRGPPYMPSTNGGQPLPPKPNGGGNNP